MARREDRRDGAALEPPFVALGRHEAPAQARRQDPELQVVLPVIGGVVHEDVADDGRVVHHGHPPERPLAGQDEILEMRLHPGVQGVLAHGAQEGHHPERLGAGLGMGRAEQRRFQGVAHAIFQGLQCAFAVASATI